MIDNTLESFKGWDEVFDYGSDETSVTLLDKKGKPIAKFNYPKFTKADFDKFKS